MTLGRAADLDNLATVQLLVGTDGGEDAPLAFYVIGANLTVPFFTVVLRKAYGLGAQAIAGGGFQLRSSRPGPRASSAAWDSRAR